MLAYAYECISDLYKNQQTNLNYGFKDFGNFLIEKHINYKSYKRRNLSKADDANKHKKHAIKQ